MMKRHGYGSLIVFIVTGLLTAGAETIFSDDFSTAGSLNGASTDTGGAWNVTSGSLSVSNGAVDTAGSSSGNPDMAFNYFTRALMADETLMFTFLTEESSGAFATTGWAGLCLYENGQERVFLGSPGGTAAWGIHWHTVDQVSTFVPSITGEAQTAVFQYIFNTGAWTFTVNGQQISGTTTSGLAFDQIRIGSDSYNYADVSVSEISVMAVPEPAAALSLAFGALVLGGYRRFFSRF